MLAIIVFNLKDLEWKVVYLGSAESSSYEQTLDEFLVGPVPVGINKFILQADAPDHTSIPRQDILGVTVLLVTCSYREKEFVRVGYYVNNEYTQPLEEEMGTPNPLVMENVMRTILDDKPRVTRFPINWGNLNGDNKRLFGNDTITKGDLETDTNKNISLGNLTLRNSSDPWVMMD